MKMPWHHRTVIVTVAPVPSPLTDSQVEALRTEFLSIVAEVRGLASSLTQFNLGLDN